MKNDLLNEFESAKLFKFKIALREIWLCVQFDQKCPIWAVVL